MDENPYGAPQAKSCVKRRVTHSARRGAVIGCLTGSVPCISIAAFRIWMNYADYSRYDVTVTIAVGLFFTVVLGALGSLLGAAILGAVHRFESRRVQWPP